VTYTAAILNIAGITEPRVSTFLDPLNAACAEFEINTPVREAMFLANVAYESDDFKALAEYWGPTPEQLRYPGGRLYCGRGLIQITGEANYRATAAYFGINMSDIANWLQSPEGACRSAAQWWYAHGCNALADANNFTGLTRRINGGLNGLAGRLAIYAAVAPALGVV
jgi:putative chitinase